LELARRQVVPERRPEADLHEAEVGPGSRHLLHVDEDLTERVGLDLVQGEDRVVVAVVAAAADGEGVVGVAPYAEIMAVKIRPNATTAVGAAGILYAVNAGAQIINLSWGTTFESGILREALEIARATPASDGPATGEATRTGETPLDVEVLAQPDPLFARLAMEPIDPALPPRTEVATAQPRTEVAATPASEPEPSEVASLQSEVEKAEVRAIIRALDASRGRRTEAAERLGISRKTLWEKIKNYGIRTDS